MTFLDRSPGRVGARDLRERRRTPEQARAITGAIRRAFQPRRIAPDDCIRQGFVNGGVNAPHGRRGEPAEAVTAVDEELGVEGVQVASAHAE